MRGHDHQEDIIQEASAVLCAIEFFGYSHFNLKCDEIKGGAVEPEGLIKKGCIKLAAFDFMDGFLMINLLQL
jgi:hypothetical protein